MALVRSGAFREQTKHEGPLVKVEIRPGVLVQLYESTARELGYLADEEPETKKRAPARNKKRSPAEDKGA